MKPSVNVSYVALNSALPCSGRNRHRPIAARSCGDRAFSSADWSNPRWNHSTPSSEQVALQREEQRRQGSGAAESSIASSTYSSPSDDRPARANARART